MQKSWFLHENCGLHKLDKLTEWDHCHRDCVEISCRTSVLSVASLFLFFRPNAHTRTMTSTRGEKDFQKEASGKRTKFLDIYLKSMTSNLYSVICISYKTILTLMPGWRSCQQMLETRSQCTSHSPCPETIVIRSTWDYFKFSGDIFSYLTQKGVFWKAHLKIIVLPSCHIRTLGKRKN